MGDFGPRNPLFIRAPVWGRGHYKSWFGGDFFLGGVPQIRVPQREVGSSITLFFFPGLFRSLIGALFSDASVTFFVTFFCQTP